MVQIQLYNFTKAPLIYELYVILMNNNKRKIKSKFTYEIELAN